MKETTNLTAEKRNGNLHIIIVGKYTTHTAHDLMNHLTTLYTGSGNIFINTTKITEIQQHSTCIDKKMLKKAHIDQNVIYLVGQQGITLNIPCNKIIVPPPRKARCGGCMNKPKERQQ